jgi:hypothetical protein
MLDISFDGFWHPTARTQLECALRNSLASPAGEVWHLLISACVSGFPYQRVVVTTPRQRRAYYFNELEPDELAHKICTWLNSYPLR